MNASIHIGYDLHGHRFCYGFFGLCPTCRDTATRKVAKSMLEYGRPLGQVVWFLRMAIESGDARRLFPDEMKLLDEWIETGVVEQTGGQAASAGLA